MVSAAPLDWQGHVMVSTQGKLTYAHKQLLYVFCEVVHVCTLEYIRRHLCCEVHCSQTLTGNTNGDVGHAKVA